MLRGLIEADVRAPAAWSCDCAAPGTCPRHGTELAPPTLALCRTMAAAGLRPEDVPAAAARMAEAIAAGAAATPAAAPGPAAPAPRPPANYRGNLAAIRACPHWSMIPKDERRGCGCAARCAIGKGKPPDGGVTYQECIACLGLPP